MKRIISGMTWFFLICSALLILLSLILRASESTENFHSLGGEKNSTQREQSRNDGDREIQEVLETTTVKKHYMTPDDYKFATGDTNASLDSYYHGGDLELPVDGATGYASVELDLIQVTQNNTNEVIAKIKAGTAFLIVKEDGEWWYIYADIDGEKKEGWVQHAFCMINLPDVIPSIIYDNTNAYSSKFLSSEEIIPGISGEQLYAYSDRFDGRTYNARLNKNEYIVPVLYSTAKRLSKAQRNAMENGDTIIMYEAYRPASTQTQVYNALKTFANTNSHIYANVTANWGMSWFIASGISNHQRGYAIDISLARIITAEDAETGGYKYRQIKHTEYYVMPTAIHELSIKAVVYKYPVTIESFDAWIGAEYSEAMKNNKPAQDLQKYCTDAGFTPLASEWWHFNDLHTYFSITKKSSGNYEIKDCLSAVPN